MHSYHYAALRRNPHPDLSGLPLFDYWRPDHDQHDLTRGGLVVYRRLRRSVSLCNAIAALAGIGQVEA